MKYSLTVDGVQFKARGVKFKEIKEFISVSKQTVYEAIELGGAEDLVTEGVNFIIKNFDTLSELLARLTTLTLEDIEELEVLTLVHIINALLKLNGVDSKKIYDFLKKAYLEKKNQPVIQTFQEVAQ